MSSLNSWEASFLFRYVVLTAKHTSMRDHRKYLRRRASNRARDCSKPARWLNGIGYTMGLSNPSGKKGEDV